jgi:hypothetical protein
METRNTKIEQAFQKFANEQQMCLTVNLYKFSELFPDQQDFYIAHFKNLKGAINALKVMSNIIGGTIQKSGRRLSFENWNTVFVVRKSGTDTYVISLENKETE